MEILAPRLCRKNMSVIVLGTMDSIGASKRPRKARPTMSGVYPTLDATPNHIHAMPMRVFDSRYIGRRPNLTARGLEGSRQA